MPDLSPAAQAVLDASWKELDYVPNRHVRWAAAAAIEALADQVVPQYANPVGDEHDAAREDQWQRIHCKILAIAAELRSQSTKQKD